MINSRILILLAMYLGTLTCKAQNFELKKQNDSLYYLNGWRLPYPVYQYQTGDVDGDGKTDAIVGVIKGTRFYPEKARRIFISSRLTARHAHCGWARNLAAYSRTSITLTERFAHWREQTTIYMWYQTTSGEDSEWPSTTIL